MKCRRPRNLALGIAAVTSLLAGAAAGDQPGGVTWDPSWSRFRPIEYVVTGAALGGTVAMALLADFRKDGPEGGFLLDGLVRDALRSHSRSGRDAALQVGDLFFRTLTLYPFVVDIGGAALLWHRKPDVAWQMFLISAESFSIAALISTGAERFIGRGRPSVAECRRDPGYEAYCAEPDSHSSFFSGHSAIAATGAALVCTHHSRLPLFGGGWGDRIVCGLAAAGAATTGIARIVNDRHYFSDVLVGWTVGVFSGYLLPRWLHYHRSGSRPTLLPQVGANGTGALLVGRF